MVQFINSLQFGAEIYSHGSSDENSGCKCRSGLRMGEAREDAIVAIDQCKDKREVIPQEFGVGTKTKNTNDESCSEVTL